MSHLTPGSIFNEAGLREVSERGHALYDTTLKAQLEPEHNNRFVALHVDTGDYEVARTSAEATRAMQKRRPLDGRLYIRRIGPELEYGPAARLLMGEMMAAKSKP